MILGFDTSAAHCAAALLSGERVLAARVEAMAKGQAERLMPLLEELLAEAGVGWRDLAALAVGVGPGNFTGVRIAVSAARGLALGLERPAIGINGFEALAEAATPMGRAATTGPTAEVLAVIAGRAGRLALARVRHGRLVGAPTEVAPGDIEGIVSRPPETIAAAGPLAAEVAPGSADWAGVRPPAIAEWAGLDVVAEAAADEGAARLAAVTGGAVLPIHMPLAEAIARAAARRLGQDLPRPAPLYLRPADAAPPSDAPPRMLS